MRSRAFTKLSQLTIGIKRADKSISFRFLSGKEEDPHKMFREQMEDLKNERQELFGFTNEDKDAWSNAGNSHQHAQSFMDLVEKARLQSESQPANSAPQGADRILVPEVEEAAHDHHPSLSHVARDSKTVHMVDVGDKQVTRRSATARSIVHLPDEVLQALKSGDNQLQGPKGPVFETAKLAGIMAAKRTSDLIPLCHPLPLDQVSIDLHLVGNNVIINCECKVTHKTGVEMEALCGASVAALTVYDMVKAVSHKVRIEDTRLVKKEGGKRTVDEP